MIDVNGGELLFRPLDTVEYKITITTAIDGAQQFTSEVHQQNEYREGHCKFVSVKENDIVIWNQHHIVHCVNNISIGNNRNLSKETLQYKPVSRVFAISREFFFCCVQFPSSIFNTKCC